MYIWIGAKLPTDFESWLRSICIPVGQKLQLDMIGFSLPQHISLKISFPTDQPQAVLEFLKERLKKERVFYVNPRSPEREGNILWMPFRKNVPLRHLHQMLDRELKEKFGIEQHPFDLDFRFHSTLFFGEESALTRVAEAFRQLGLPGILRIDTLLLGVSDTGKSGSYRVVAEIPLKEKTSP